MRLLYVRLESRDHLILGLAGHIGSALTVDDQRHGLSAFRSTGSRRFPRQATSVKASRISSTVALSAAFVDRWDHVIVPSGITISVPPSWATSPIGRPWTERFLIDRPSPFKTTLGPISSAAPPRIAPASL